MKYRIQPSGLGGYNRRTIEGDNLHQAIAKEYAYMVEGNDWGTRVPYPIEVFGKNGPYEITSQQIINIVANQHGKKSYDVDVMTCFG